MSIENWFEKADVRDGMRTRQAAGLNNLKVQAARTDIRKNFFTIRAAKAWNELPDSLKNEPDKEKFKRGLRKYWESGGRS
jgi:hypothetical protein